MSELITFSVSVSFKKRLEELLPKGQRSEFVVRAVSKELDKLDTAKRTNREREVWLKENVVPILDGLLKGKSAYQIMDYEDPERITYISSKVKSSLGHEISEEHLIMALRMVRNGRE